MKTKISSHIKPYKGKPAIYINDQPVLPFFYALTDTPGGRWSWEEVPARAISTFGNIGTILFQLDIFFDHIWFPDGTMSTEIAQKQIRGVLDCCPEGMMYERGRCAAWPQYRL